MASIEHIFLRVIMSRGARPYIRQCVKDNMKDALTVSTRMSQRDFSTTLANTMAVLAIPGMGYDTYRLWETLALGAMPVLERGVGLDRTLYRLPALLLDDFADLTEDLLRQAYVEALYRADDVSVVLHSANLC